MEHMEWAGTIEEGFLQRGMLGSVVCAAVAWFFSHSTNSMLYTYLAGVLVTLLVIVPDYNHFKRPLDEWTDVVFLEPATTCKQVRKLAMERDMQCLAENTITVSGAAGVIDVTGTDLPQLIRIAGGAHMRAPTKP